MIPQVQNQMIEDSLAKRAGPGQRRIIGSAHERGADMIEHCIVVRHDREGFGAESGEIFHLAVDVMAAEISGKACDELLAPALPLLPRLLAPTPARRVQQIPRSRVEVETENSEAPHASIANPWNALSNYVVFAHRAARQDFVSQRYK